MTDGCWTEIAVSVPFDRADAAADVLRDLAPGGIAIQEPYVPLDPEEGVRLESWRPAVLTLYLPVDASFAERRRLLAERLSTLPEVLAVNERPLREQDWAQSWKEFFQVEHVGRRIVVRPTWRDYSPRPNEIVIDLDPGMAFGTGQHPTTRLCLRALEDLVQPGIDLLDLGCGSGILALAAARLGCRSVLALDVEPVAVEAARGNVRQNHLEQTIQVERGSLGNAWPLATPAIEFCDLLVANIHSAAIGALGAPIATALRPGARFIGSGIVDTRIDEALVGLAAGGLRIEEIQTEGDWRAIIARRPA